MSKWRVPFEGEPHAATWCCWPFDDAEWKGQLEGTRQELLALMHTLRECEPVRLLVDVDEEGPGGEDFRLPLDDVWFRDSGPIFVKQENRVAPTTWIFNAWGGKYKFAKDSKVAPELCRRLGVRAHAESVTLEGGALEVDGHGSAISTFSCLRDADLPLAEFERRVGAALGIERWIWLESGLEGDHTDGHIDTLTRFVTPGRVLSSSCGTEDTNYATLERNRRQLVECGLEVVDLPIPSAARIFDGGRLPETYANYYLANGLVIVPQYGDIHDDRALGILREQFPERSVVGLSSRFIITGGGSFHCLTQQQPEGQLCDWD